MEHTHMIDFKESLIEKLKLEKSGKMTKTWESFDKGIDRAIEIIRHHEVQQPSDDVVDKVTMALMKEDNDGTTPYRQLAKAAIAAMNMGDAGKDLTPNSSTKYARSTDQGAHDAGGLNPPPSTHTLIDLAKSVYTALLTYAPVGEEFGAEQAVHFLKDGDELIKRLQQREITENFVSKSCGGEKCSMCGEPAERKVGEEIFHDDPTLGYRHNLTAYVCKKHFDQIMDRGGWRKQPMRELGKYYAFDNCHQHDDNYSSQCKQCTQIEGQS